MSEFDVNNFKWEPHSAGMGGERVVIDFDNGFSASVLRGGPFYTKGGTYELAVMHADKLHYDNPVADGDVRGSLSAPELYDLLSQIKAFEPIKADA